MTTNPSRTKSSELCILIVEDSRSLAVAMQRLIRSQLGLRADIAASLEQARGLIDGDRNRYVLAILDLTLPDATKDEVVHEITNRGIPSIIFSNLYDENLREELLEHGVIDFVVKSSPSSLTYILQLIKRILKNQFIQVLFVDDSNVARRMSVRLLQIYQFIVLEASSGQEALEILEQETRIKLVIVDYHMPGMNGDELTAKIRSQFTKDVMAIIGISSELEHSLSGRFLKAGANDYIRKPFLPEEFFSRISQNLESLELIEEIRRHRDLLSMEREIIESILTKMRTTTRFDDRDVRYLMQPVEKTSGDLLLAARRPDGTQHVMLGDFTGHGLQAALGGPLVTELFYDMTSQNLPLEQIINAINHKITHAMPTDMFLASGFIEIHPARSSLTVWNCSMPDILIYREESQIRRIPSSMLPRGIRDQPIKPGEFIEISPGDRVFLFSDGIIEEMDPEENSFDYVGIEAFLARVLTENLPLSRLLIALENHRQGYEQQDDVTLVEILC
ncbi:MAG: fused response regulator/phosphatase [Magnetococcus sp. YQC-5]